jgi:hypothetical protein
MPTSEYSLKSVSISEAVCLRAAQCKPHTLHSSLECNSGAYTQTHKISAQHEDVSRAWF